FDRQRIEQHGVDEREDRRVRADAQRQRQRRDDGETWRLGEQARAELQILQQRQHWHDSTLDEVAAPPVRVGGPFRLRRYDLGVASRHADRTPRTARSVAPAATGPEAEKKKGITPGAWDEARALIWHHRKRLALGLSLMLVNRLSGLVLPT